ncbi:MAG: capsule assembly Wzi family protein [Betaproteobacteria bacterium]|nr:capsule assembly Wzi family protein [Betaproteobacteria bacterium]
MAAFGFTRARLAGLALAAMVAGGNAAASVDLPLHHWVYDDLERLAALGAIRGAMISAKPFSRKQAARYAARALDPAAAARLGSLGFLLERLARELRPELVELGALAAREGETRARLRYGARVQVGLASSSLDAGGSVRARENSEGEYFTDGAHGEVDLRGWAEFGDGAALTLRPKYTSDPHQLGVAPTDNSARTTLREADLKLTWGNLSVHLGRGSQWWGAGHRGTLLLSDNAFPLERLRVGSEEPFRLPGILARLGEWKIDSFLGVFEREREFPRARLFGLRVSYVPTEWMEAGLTRLTQFAGPALGQSFPAIVWKTYISHPNKPGADEVNEQVMLDLRVRIPRTPYLVPFPGGMQLYGELGSEDRWASPRPTRAAYLLGLYLPQVVAGDSTDLRIEYADTDITRRGSGFSSVWYNNGTYSSGMRHYGIPLGHSMGTDATDFYLRAGRHLSADLQVGIAFDRTARGRWQPAPETKHEFGLDLKWSTSQKAQLQAGYTLQRVRNPIQIVNVNPVFAVSSTAAGPAVTSHFLWSNLTFQF